MEDLNSKLSSLLSDPQAMQEIAALASSLGADSSGVHNAQAPAADASAASAMSGIMPLLSSLKSEDDTTRLLEAIRPFLSPERRSKLDKAKKILRIMRLMPMLRELDLFDL